MSQNYTKQPLATRFWKKVDITPGCWLWTASTDRKGYGKFTVTLGGRVRWRIAPRVSWELANGPIPDGSFVLHRCDNPKCVNPDHLFLGDHKANMADARSKGRVSHGELRWSSTLKESDVEEILMLLGEELKQQDIALAYGVSQSVITRIKNGDLWKHIKRPENGIIRPIDGRGIANAEKARRNAMEKVKLK